MKSAKEVLTNQFKNLIAVLAIVTLFFGCTDQSKNNPIPATAPKLTDQPSGDQSTSTSSSAQPTEGGITSGGGGVLPDDPATIDQIEYFAEKSRESLDLYFKYIENNRSDKKYAGYAKLLFDGPKTIYEVLNFTRIEVQKDKPCYDHANNEVDGSVMGSTSHSFCVSAFRIAPKVSKQMAFIEVVGLVAHELTHFLGSTEIEAVQIQKDLVVDFFIYGVTTSNFADHLLGDPQNEQNNITSDVVNKYVRLLDVYNETNSEKDELKILTSFYNSSFGGHHYNFDFDFAVKPYYLFSHRQMAIHDYINAQLRVLSLYACEKVAPMDVSESCKKTKNIIFEGKDQIQFINYRNSSSLYLDVPIINSLPLYNVTNSTDVDKVKSSVLQYYMLMILSLGYFHDEGAQNHIGFAIWAFAKNPWENFVGIYNVTSQACKIENGNLANIPVANKFEIKSESLPGFMYSKAPEVYTLTTCNFTNCDQPMFLSDLYFNNPTQAKATVGDLQNGYNGDGQTEIKITPTGYQLHNERIYFDYTNNKNIFYSCDYELKKVK